MNNPAEPPAEHLARMKKLKALAERGIGGEKENAQFLLEKLCAKYDITPESLGTEETKQLRWFRYRKGKHFRKLLAQCMFQVAGKGSKTYVHTASRKRELATDCTAAEAVEIELNYEFYANALQVEITRLTEMFIQKNSLFPPGTETSGECTLSEEDINMYKALTRRTRRPMIGGEQGAIAEYNEDDDDDDDE